MERKIKLIWDFRGPDASAVAQHHEVHLKEYIAHQKLSLNLTGHQDLGAAHSIAYMVVEEAQMIPVRDALLPHRGEVYQE